MTTLLIPFVAQGNATPVDTTADNITRFIGNADGISYYVAHFIMKIVDWILSIFGLQHDTGIETFFYTAIVLCIALFVGWIVQWVVLKITLLITKRWSLGWYEALKRQRFFHKICRIVPPIVFLTLIKFTLSSHDVLTDVLSRITVAYIVFVVTVAVNALIMAIWEQFDARANKRKLPLMGLAQLAKGIVWIIAVIVIIAIFVDKSPGKLLAGLGAFSAVLLLIFKNNILSLVAGVQLSENDSLHVGDWIAVPGTNANGTVMDVSLVAVKIQNWDKTTTTLPPYNLISNGFTNYRSMQQSNTRRVCRSFMIDADSIIPATPQLLDELRKIPFMQHYIDTKLAQKVAGQVADINNPAGLVNGTIDTNLGLFRAYMKMWLDANPNVSHDSDCFVSTLPQTSTGIPFQVYCFTSTSAWFPYEAIQDSIFEHLASMLHFFQLYTFENPSGRDTVIDGYLSPGKPLDKVYGIPYPFFQDPAFIPAQPTQGAPIGGATQSAQRSQGTQSDGATQAPKG